MKNSFLIIKALMLIAFFIGINGHMLKGQDKWQHGVSIGIAFTDYAKDNVSSVNSEKYTFETVVRTSFKIWNQYRLTKNLNVNISPGFGWRGAHLISEGINYDGVHFLNPIQLEFKLSNRLAAGGGMEYSYLISFGESSDKEVYNLTSDTSQRHLFSSLAHLRYTINHNISFTAEYNHGLNSFYRFSRFNTSGGTLDKVDLSNRGLLFSIIIHA